MNKVRCPKHSHYAIKCEFFILHRIWWQWRCRIINTTTCTLCSGSTYLSSALHDWWMPCTKPLAISDFFNTSCNAVLMSIGPPLSTGATTTSALQTRNIDQSSTSLHRSQLKLNSISTLNIHDVHVATTESHTQNRNAIIVCDADNRDIRTFGPFRWITKIQWKFTYTSTSDILMLFV